MHYNPIPHDYSKDYLTFEVVEGGTITLKAMDSSVSKTIQYSTDNGNTWIDLTTTTTAQTLGETLNVGDKILVKGNNISYGKEKYPYDYGNRFGGTAKIIVYGNIMSLISGDDFDNNVTLTGDRTFYDLFRQHINLLSAKNLILPATTLVEYCYYNMFNGCTNLIDPPKLPATTITNHGYASMFRNCTSLTKTPDLPATTLGYYCYYSMFEGCTNLVEVSELPATVMNASCYRSMFARCTSLTTAPELPSIDLAGSCYQSMFDGCSSLIEAPELPATTLMYYCYG